MRYIFKFPDIGEGITEGKILEWYVDKGSAIREGDSVVKMETDKVVADIPSPKTGTIATRFGNVGDVINVDDPLVEIDIEGVAGAAAVEVAAEKPAPPSDHAVEEANFGVVGTLEVAGDGAFLPSSQEGQTTSAEPEEKKTRRKALATPVARAMAKEYGLDINRIPGTGPGGRVTKKDVAGFRDISTKPSALPASHTSAQADGTRVEPLSQIRKAIARNMTISKQTIPHMSVFEDVEVSRLVEFRSRQKPSFEAEGRKLTYLAFAVKAVALALERHPVLNAKLNMDEGVIVYQEAINIGIAIDTEEGLVVPVIRHANRLSVSTIADQIREMADKARDRKLEIADLKGGTFTITNFGAIGGLHAQPIINPPQAAILGIGRLVEKPVVENGEVVAGQVLPLSLTVDHRIVDGGETTRFLNQIMEYLRDPAAMLM
jgi:pyruvate dehydrogenase E2 component (dihydrolipoamide acetyltransferase)